MHPLLTHRLIVGLCVGVPVIIIIIVGVIVLYCICAHYQNKKMQRLTVAYNRHRNQTQQDGDNFLSPPPYTRTTNTSNKTTDSALPAYSAADPYASSVVTSPAPPTVAPEREEQGDSGNRSCEIVVMEDIPLLSDDEIQS